MERLTDETISLLTERNKMGNVPYWTWPTSTFTQFAANKLADYIQAESEGRLIVMPCKVGDEFWYIAGTIRGNDYVTSGVVSCFECWDDHVSVVDTNGVDHYVFWLTREEAEAALRTEQDNE